jgi:hypothetical protein
MTNEVIAPVKVRVFSKEPTWCYLSDVLNFLLQENRFHDASRIASRFPDKGIVHTLDTSRLDYGFTVTGNDVIDFEEILHFFPGNPEFQVRLRSHVARYSYN